MSRVSTAKGDRAEIIRELYVKGLRRAGIQVNDLEGAWATFGIDRVVMPYAQELRNNRFLLHVQSTLLDAGSSPYLVLLCEKKDGDIIDIVIPPGRSRTILRKVSRVGRGLKLNVMYTDDKWEVLLPYAGREDVTPYIARWPRVAEQAQTA